MFVPMFNLSICYLFILLIQTIISEHSCVYDIGNNQKLDIRTLGRANGKVPKYDNIPNSVPVPYVFSWNGCFPYSKSDDGNCSDAAACSTNKDTGKSIVIAKQSNAIFEHHGEVNLLVYQSSNTLLTVYLTCRDVDEDTINGRQDDAHTYNLYIQSRCCCPNKCHYSSGSIGTGAILVIILVVVLFVYIVGGMLFLKYQRGATGPDMIPNRIMWLNVTSHAIDGLRYSIQVVRNRSFNVSYEKI